MKEDNILQQMKNKEQVIFIHDNRQIEFTCIQINKIIVLNMGKARL